MAIDLVTRRFERLERAQRQTNETLGRVASILEVHSTHFERIEEALMGISGPVDRLAERVDRLAETITLGRTRDQARLRSIERRRKRS